MRRLDTSHNQTSGPFGRTGSQMPSERSNFPRSAVTLPESPGMSARPHTSMKGAKDYPFGNVTLLSCQSVSTLDPLTNRVPHSRTRSGLEWGL